MAWKTDDDDDDDDDDVDAIIFVRFYLGFFVCYANSGAHAPSQMHFGQKLTNCVGVKPIDST